MSVDSVTPITFGLISAEKDMGSDFSSELNGFRSLPTLCALISASIASAATQPADVVRLHRQLLFASSPSSCIINSDRSIRLSWYSLMWNILRTDGPFGLWRGLSLRLIRRVGMASVSWTLFEAI
ncbi:unnamed protein product [Protopolystoma xenopodis]|uniref:Uncharacterized protein n=1 Tax=Protopolystoma xenopodis TaxID=117903 RepID=A0A3S4ZPF5_9PLAT|nr:unnamed protein product [Protopolystoma xenopodis]